MLLSRSVLFRVADCLLATAAFLAPLLPIILQHSILEQFVGYPGFVAVLRQANDHCTTDRHGS